MARSDQTRRELLVRGGALLGAIGVPGVLSACGGEAQEAASGGGAPKGPVVFADYGGTTRDARTTAMFAPIEKSIGIRVIPADADNGRFQVMAKRGRSQWDVADLNGSDAINFAKQGLLQKLPASVRRSDFVPEKWRDIATAGYAVSNNIGYSVDQFRAGRKPEAWADFFDVARFPGRRALLRNYNPGAVEGALIADGVSPADLYPLDFDRAFAKLDSIRDHVLFAADYAGAQQALLQRSVSMAFLPNGRIDALQRESPSKVGIVWNESLLSPWTASGIPKGAPHPEAAFRLLDAMMDPQRQADFAKLTAYGPASEKAIGLIDKATLARLPNSPEHRAIAVVIDQEALAAQRDEYLKRYIEWVGG